MRWTNVSLLLAIFITAGAVAKEPTSPVTFLYVSPDGNNANPGTRDKPLATITGARDAVRKIIAAGLERDVTVTIAGGVYRITEPIVFGVQDSGTAKHTITYQAADPGHPPIISGGRAISGWKENENGSWSTVLPDVKVGSWRFRELFINGERRYRARYPNEGYARVVDAFDDQRSGFFFDEKGFPKGLTGEHGLEVVLLHDWSTSRVAVANVDYQKHSLRVADPLGPAAEHYKIQNWEQHPRYFLNNDPALLDAPGEWYLNTTSGRLTSRPQPGEAIANVKAVAPVATSLLEMRGKPGEPIVGLRFRGIQFQHCAWPIPEHGYAAGQAGFHEARDGSEGNEIRQLMPAAVTVELARNCRFQNCRVSHVGGSGIWLSSRTQDCTLAGCVISDTAGNGVMIGETRSRKVDRRAWWQVAPEQAASKNVVRDCVIARPGQLYYGAVGIWIGMANHTRIVHNTIRQTPYTGISVGWMWNPKPTPCHHNEIGYNHIHHVMQTLSDGGGIYTLGRQPGTRLIGNVIHDVPKAAGRAESNGMFLDEGTAELMISGNLIYNIAQSPLRFHQAKENMVQENVMEVAEGEPPVRYNSTPEENINLKKNTIVPAKEFDLGDYQDIINNAGSKAKSGSARK